MGYCCVALYNQGAIAHGLLASPVWSNSQNTFSYVSGDKIEGKKLSTVKQNLKVQGANIDLALHTIGWKSFQDLCAHICETELERTIDVYREANDGGQDATFLIASKPSDDLAVGTVQCKHASDPNRRMKLSDLTTEIPKIKRLVKDGQAETYIFVSNMGLDAPVAKDIRQKLFELGVKSPYVWGKEKLVSVIRSSARLRALVPQVYGLGDLSTIIDERAVEQTRAMLGHWLPKLKTYVTTASHDKAVRALERHGAVLLLGNPSTGKSTIGAILSTIASEDCGHTVLQVTSPRDFETHWNTHDKRRFFWIDDAFGSNVLREDFVQDWSALFSKVRTAIELGNRFLFTSRRHIYKAAAPKLGKRNLEAFSSGEAVVDVGNLSDTEQSQILYNHINFGDQSKAWKKRAKPHLEAVARTQSFLPGIAERLGNPAFTKSLAMNEASLVGFMAKPQDHLVETIEELEPQMRAALVLVFAYQGLLPIAAPKKEILDAVEDATGVKFPQIGEVLSTLEGSFLRKIQNDEGEEIWGFEHPTISDALTTILDGQPQMLSALLRGASASKVLSDFVCHGMPKVRDTVTVSQELSDVLVDRLLSVPDETFPNGSLFRFLADRASSDVFQKVISKDPTILARRMWFYGDAWLNPKFSVHARAASFGLLPDDCRDETARLLEEAALENLDLTFVEDEALISLIPDKNLFALGAKVRIFIEEQIEDRISDIGSSADLDEDAESNFETVTEGLRVFEEVTELDVERDDPYLEARAAIDREIENIHDQQEEKRKEEEESDAADWVFAETQSSPPVSPASPAEQHKAQRSIFDDIDR